MLALALRSVRKRPGRFFATLLAAFLGAGVTMTFNSLRDTAGAAGVDKASADSLTTISTVVGGYGTLLVFFAIASTLTINVRQRASEMHLLRSTGATPAQIKRMVVGEAALVALLGTVLAIGPAMLGGRVLLDMFKDSGQISDGVSYTFGSFALTAGLLTNLVAGIGAAFLAVRRATRAEAGGRAPRTRLRTVGGALALIAGVGGVTTTFAMDADEPGLMASPAYGAILISVGFATLSPALLRSLLGRLGRPIAALAGAGGYMAVENMRKRAAQLSGILMPLIMFTAVATATLYMQGVENSALDAAGVTQTTEDKNLQTLNLVVVGIIAAFACLMLINSLYAATSYRGPEFGRQRLAGSTPRQVLATVATEGVVLSVTGLFFGTVAALAGIIPFTMVRTDATLPDQGPGIWLAVAGIGAAATLVTGLVTTRRALHTPAVSAVAVAA
ncbi:FtsX-like permease family protein [Streptomyces sp. NPDC050560]|uniref:ABC transporter permease n=1 Tax=Streptomyces sp. NPDC050560 TaxID=3365630 RepID=UPI0037A84C2F